MRSLHSLQVFSADEMPTSGISVSAVSVSAGLAGIVRSGSGGPGGPAATGPRKAVICGRWVVVGAGAGSGVSSTIFGLVKSGKLTIASSTEAATCRLS